MDPKSLLIRSSFAAAAITFAAPGWAGPVDLLEADTQAFVQDSGAMDVIYSLRYQDNEGRSAIKSIGQFYEPVAFTRGILHAGNNTIAVTMSPNGGGYYKASFDSAVPRGTYTLELHYRSDKRFAEPTVSNDGKNLLAVWFNPVRWTMPIEKSIVKLVLPLPLEGNLQRPEDITPAMVDGLGVITDDQNKRLQDHFAFVYSDYQDSRRLTVYTEKKSLPAQGVHMVRIYIPQSSMPNLSKTSNTRPDATIPAIPTDTGSPATSAPVTPRDVPISFGDYAARAIVLAILSFFLNPIALFAEFLVLGLPLWIIDKIAKTTLLRKIFLPANEFKFAHPTKGTILGWTAVLVPFRLTWAIIAGLGSGVVALLRLHPIIELYIKKKAPVYESPEITVSTFRKGRLCAHAGSRGSGGGDGPSYQSHQFARSQSSSPRGHPGVEPQSLAGASRGCVSGDDGTGKVFFEVIDRAGNLDPARNA